MYAKQNCQKYCAVGQDAESWNPSGNFNSYDKLIYKRILISSYLRSIGGQKKYASIDDDIQNK